MDLQLVDMTKDKTLAILFDVDVQKCLNHVRNLIDEQVSDLLPSDMYSFYHNGMKISKDMEIKLTVAQIAKLEDNNSSVILLAFNESKDFDKFDSTTPRINEVVPISTMTPSSPCATQQNNCKMMALKSPSTAELRGLKIYTEDEIKIAKGSQKEYRRFWNKKIKELGKNNSLSNQKVCERVNEEWRFYKTTLLVRETEDAEKSESTRLKSGDNRRQNGPKAKRMKTEQRAHDLEKQISQRDKDLQHAVGSSASQGEIKADLSRLQSSLDSTKSEIRKAQDTLRKNLKKKQSDICTFIRSDRK